MGFFYSPPALFGLKTCAFNNLPASRQVVNALNNKLYES